MPAAVVHDSGFMCVSGGNAAESRWTVVLATLDEIIDRQDRALKELAIKKGTFTPLCKV